MKMPSYCEHDASDFSARDLDLGAGLTLGRALCRVLLVGTSGGGSGEVRGALGDAPDDSFLRRDSALMGGSRLLLLRNRRE